MGEEQAGDDEDSAGAVLQVGGLGLWAEFSASALRFFAGSGTGGAGGEEAP